jgi:hypothetical protein
MKHNYYDDDVRTKYRNYTEWFELERDRDCDYETEPYTFDEFEDIYVWQHEND